MIKDFFSFLFVATLAFALLVTAMAIIGCGDTYYIVDPVADAVLTQPVAPEPVPVVDTTPGYNPFANSLEHVASTFAVLEHDILIIAAMPSGIEILAILIDDVSIERKAAKILALPASDAKTMLLQASVDHLDTIQQLSGLFTLFAKDKTKDKPKAKKKQPDNSTAPPDDNNDDDSDVIGTVIAAIIG